MVPHLAVYFTIKSLLHFYSRQTNTVVASYAHSHPVPLRFFFFRAEPRISDFNALSIWPRSTWNDINVTEVRFSTSLQKQLLLLGFDMCKCGLSYSGQPVWVGLLLVCIRYRIITLHKISKCLYSHTHTWDLIRRNLIWLKIWRRVRLCVRLVRGIRSRQLRPQTRITGPAGNSLSRPDRTEIMFELTIRFGPWALPMRTQRQKSDGQFDSFFVCFQTAKPMTKLIYFCGQSNCVPTKLQNIRSVDEEDAFVTIPNYTIFKQKFAGFGLHQVRWTPPLKVNLKYTP